MQAILLVIGAGVVLVGAGLGTWWWQSSGQPVPLFGATHPSARPAPTFVGQKVCRQCHEQTAQRWDGSHHDRAMQPATESTVAGDFGNARFTYAAVTSTFFRRDGKFVARTDGPGGALHDYEIKYTFGVTPLQRYDQGPMVPHTPLWDARGNPGSRPDHEEAWP